MAPWAIKNIFFAGVGAVVLNHHVCSTSYLRLDTIYNFLYINFFVFVFGDGASTSSFFFEVCIGGSSAFLVDFEGFTKM